MQKKLLGLFALSFVFLPGMVTAASDPLNPVNNTTPPSYTLLEPLPCIPAKGIACPASTDGTIATQDKIVFSDYIQYLFNLIIAISAVMAVLVLVWGGFKYVTTDSFGGKEEGRKVITQALQGLLLVLCSYLILRTIDPRLVAIPTTLVTPLNITDNMRTSTTEFLSSLSEAAGINYKDKATELRRQNNINNAQVATLEDKEDALLNQISDLTGAESVNDIMQVCSEKNNSSEVNDLCLNLLNTNDEKRKILGDISVNKAIGVMSLDIKKCMDAVIDPSAQASWCADAKKVTAEKYRSTVAELRSTGQLDRLDQTRDYYFYSQALIDINSQLGQLQRTPATEAFFNSVHQINTTALTTAGTIFGATRGAPIKGAVGGYLAGQAVGIYTSSSLSKSEKETAAIVSKSIKSLSSTVAIKDPEMAALFQEQVNLILKGIQ